MTRITRTHLARSLSLCASNSGETARRLGLTCALEARVHAWPETETARRLGLTYALEARVHAWPETETALRLGIFVEHCLSESKGSWALCACLPYQSQMAFQSRLCGRDGQWGRRVRLRCRYKSLLKDFALSEPGSGPSGLTREGQTVYWLRGSQLRDSISTVVLCVFVGG